MKRFVTTGPDLTRIKDFTRKSFLGKVKINYTTTNEHVPSRYSKDKPKALKRDSIYNIDMLFE